MNPAALQHYIALSRRDQLFVDAYVETGVGSEAIVRAYPGRIFKRPKVKASKLLAKPQIWTAVEERRAEAISAAGVTSVHVLRRIYQTMERCAQVEPIVDQHGKQVMVTTPSGEFSAAFRFDAKGVLKAAELLGDHLKLFTKVHEVTGKGGGPIRSAVAVATNDPVEAARIYQEMMGTGGS